MDHLKSEDRLSKIDFMQIPKESQHFAHPTLIVIGDFEHAKLYLAHGETIEEIKTLQAPEPHQPDMEGDVGVGGKRYGSISNDVDEGARRLPYAKQLAGAIIDSLRKGRTRYACLVMPAEMCHRIKEELPQDLRDNVTKTIEAHMIDAPLTEVLERLGQ